MASQVRYLVNEEGQRVGVVLDLKEYEKMLQELEELEAIRAYDAAKASGDEAIPLDQAVAEIERDRTAK
ncbi:MAG TPA: hypothetical protein GXX55_03235 [Firmicutes bacterium]|nr:hypothetical protein [Bacillota bacterium]